MANTSGESLATISAQSFGEYRATSAPRVLVADDDPSIQLIAKTVLAGEGFDVIQARDGSEAISVLDTTNIDLLLCDVLMPEVDGYEVCRYVRAHADYRLLPILMLTSLDDIESIEKAYKLGATEFALKPINWTLLPKRVRYILRASQTLNALRESEERYALAARGANDGLWDWDLQRDTIYYSPRWAELIGAQDKKLSDSPCEWFNRVHPEERERTQQDLRRLIAEETENFELQFRIHREDGTFRWMLARGLVVRDENQRPFRVAGSMTDISAQVEAQEKLAHDAFHDSLTGLPNRTLFLDRLERALRAAEREPDRTYAVLFIDLDRFKTINDSLGHWAGDQLLLEVARRLNSVLRSSDTLARLSGDEFTILLEATDGVASAEVLAERIHEVLGEPFSLARELISISASIGIAPGIHGYRVADEILRDADSAMYRAKESGRSRSVVFSAEMHVQAMNSLRIESELKVALEKDELFLEYQPIIDLKSQQVAGFEALLRWTHPTRGVLEPNDFLSVAIDSREICRIGNWVIDEACRQLSVWQLRWPRAKEWFITVNISGIELLQPGLLDYVQTVLQRHAVAAKTLRLEFSEQALARDAGRSLSTLGKLRELGVQLAIDDFGSAASPWQFLRSLSISSIKVDRALIDELLQSGSRNNLLRSITSLADHLGVCVDAKGAEDDETIKLLRDLRVRHRARLRDRTAAEGKRCQRGVRLKVSVFGRWCREGDAMNTESPLKLSAGRRPLILVVDDDPMTQSIVRVALSAASVDCHQVTSGSDALKVVEERCFDAILLDILMPGIDGFTTCERLRSQPHLTLTPIIMMTGLEDVTSVRKAFDCGATDFVSKPMNLELLVQRLRFVLKAHETLESLHDQKVRLREAQRLANLGEWEWDRNGEGVQLSAQLRNMLQIPEHLRFESVHDLSKYVWPDDWPKLKSRVGRLLTSGESFSFEHRIISSTGAVRVVRHDARVLNASVHTIAGKSTAVSADTEGDPRRLLNGDEGPTRILGIVQDVTHLRSAEERAEYVASHDELTGASQPQCVDG